MHGHLWQWDYRTQREAPAGGMAIMNIPISRAGMMQRFRQSGQRQTLQNHCAGLGKIKKRHCSFLEKRQRRSGIIRHFSVFGSIRPARQVWKRAAGYGG